MMFAAEQDIYVPHHRKARRRYWWAVVCFAVGLWLGYVAGHLF